MVQCSSEPKVWCLNASNCKRSGQTNSRCRRLFHFHLLATATSGNIFMHPARISQQSRYGPYGRTTPTHGSPAQPGPRPVQIFGRSVSNPNVSQPARELDSSSPLPSRRFGSQLQNMPSSFSWGLPSCGHDGGTDSGFGSEYSSEQCPPDDQLQSQHRSAVGGGPPDIEFEYGPSSDLTAVISSLGLDAAATEKAYSFASLDIDLDHKLAFAYAEILGTSVKLDKALDTLGDLKKLITGVHKASAKAGNVLVLDDEQKKVLLGLVKHQLIRLAPSYSVKSISSTATAYAVSNPKRFNLPEHLAGQDVNKATVSALFDGKISDFKSDYKKLLWKHAKEPLDSLARHLVSKYHRMSRAPATLSNEILATVALQELETTNLSDEKWINWQREMIDADRKAYPVARVRALFDCDPGQIHENTENAQNAQTTQDHPDPPPNSVTISAATTFAPTGTLDKANEAPQERGDVQRIREAVSAACLQQLSQLRCLAAPEESSVDPAGIQRQPHRYPGIANSQESAGIAAGNPSAHHPAEFRWVSVWGCSIYHIFASARERSNRTQHTQQKKKTQHIQ
ncbi:hypothetical protein CPB85DRAFT_1456559 [Mucidula mucida]|nr:hypothetical protein CPB85DRAFT_1456559 [Mucidula mucida]